MLNVKYIFDNLNKTSQNSPSIWKQIASPKLTTAAIPAQLSTRQEKNHQNCGSAQTFESTCRLLPPIACITLRSVQLASHLDRKYWLESTRLGQRTWATLAALPSSMCASCTVKNRQFLICSTWLLLTCTDRSKVVRRWSQSAVLFICCQSRQMASGCQVSLMWQFNCLTVQIWLNKKLGPNQNSRTMHCQIVASTSGRSATKLAAVHSSSDALPGQ